LRCQTIPGNPSTEPIYKDQPLWPIYVSNCIYETYYVLLFYPRSLDSWRRFPNRCRAATVSNGRTGFQDRCMEGFEPSLGVYSLKGFSKRSSLRPCCSESIVYGGWRRHIRAKIALFGNNCSPVVPQLLFGFSISTDFSSHGRFMRDSNTK
jgi:hypothetical protein